MNKKTFQKALKNGITKGIRLFCYYCTFVVILNVLFYYSVGVGWFNMDEIDDNGFIIKIKPLNIALAFVHGEKSAYLEPDGSITYVHKTDYNGKTISTYQFLDWLNKEGYTNVWGTWCYSGDGPLYENTQQGKLIKWSDYNVKYNPNPGKTIVLFNGLYFSLISV